MWGLLRKKNPNNKWNYYQTTEKSSKLLDGKKIEILFYILFGITTLSFGLEKLKSGIMFFGGLRDFLKYLGSEKFLGSRNNLLDPVIKLTTGRDPKLFIPKTVINEFIIGITLVIISIFIFYLLLEKNNCLLFN